MSEKTDRQIALMCATESMPSLYSSDGVVPKGKREQHTRDLLATAEQMLAFLRDDDEATR